MLRESCVLLNTSPVFRTNVYARASYALDESAETQVRSRETESVR